MKKDVIITFDYEVFLGEKTGTIENSVIKPTQHILEVLKHNNAKAIFFVDATWLLFLKDNFPADLQIVSKQLLEIIKAGSTIELHLHPQWINAYKTGNRIGFKSYENYKLHSLSQEDILILFGKSIELLESIIMQKVQGFRAGGYCIEPFIKIKSAFETYEIKYDFSVAPGMQSTEDNRYGFDFSDAPDLPFYPFQNDVKIPNPDGSFIEIPLSTYKSNPIYRLLNKVHLILLRDRIMGDGKGLEKNTHNLINLLNRVLNFPIVRITFDCTSNKLFRVLVQNHFKKSNLLVIVSHPKTLSKQGLSNLRYIIQRYNTLNSMDLEKSLFN